MRVTGILFVLLMTGMLWLACSNSTEPNKGPGQIVKTEVPDSIAIPPAGYFNRALVKAWVEDPDGLSDVDSVYFFSQKPNGEYANGGKPFPLVDNGMPFNIQNPWEEAGDEKAGDGIYSLSILVPNDAQTGRYLFTFYMRDKAGNLSEAKVDSIEVYK